MALTLDALPLGITARVSEIAPGNLRTRLMDIGFTRGSEARFLFAAPSGEPRAYLIRGAVVAIRREDAKTVVLDRSTLEADR